MVLLREIPNLYIWMCHQLIVKGIRFFHAASTSLFAYAYDHSLEQLEGKHGGMSYKQKQPIRVKKDIFS